MGAESLTLIDGTTLTGDIVKTEDNGLMLREAGDVYTNLTWPQFSQATLKQLAQNPKLGQWVEPFIDPDASQRPPKPEIRVSPVTRIEQPAHPSLFGGLVQSSLGMFILLVLYLANLYAAFEVAIVRGRPLAPVIGLSAVLPVIGPIIFLAQPIKVDAPPEEAAGEPVTGAGTAEKPEEEIQIVAASWKTEEKKPEIQIFARGKFTFNKRFIETKFAGFIGELKGDGKLYTMDAKTSKEQFAVVRIAQVGATEVIFETAQRQIVVPLADIQEIKLTPKPA